jgi:hypothetical protein
MYITSIIYIVKTCDQSIPTNLFLEHDFQVISNIIDLRFITSGFLSLPGKKYLLIGNDCHLIHKDKRMCWNVNNITSNYSTN